MSGWRYGMAAATLAFAILAVEVLVGRAVPLRVPLQELPFRLSTWRGTVEPIDPVFLQRARPDEVLHRRYVDEAGGVVSVYVGYYERQAARGQAQAACQVDCKVLNTGVEVIDVQDGPITVNRAFVREGWSFLAVLYWYQQGSVVTHDPYRGKIAQARRVLRSRRSEGALVRVSAPIVTTADEALERSVAFVKAVFPALRPHLPD